MKWEKTLKDVITGGQVYNKKVSGELVLNDLKALALSLSASSDEGDEEIISLVRNFIDSLEQMQIINRYSSEESGRYLLPLPAMFDETFKFGQILIDLGGGKKDANDPKNRIIRIAFILELTKLGDLKADFSILKQSITGTFGVGTSELCAYIKSGIPGLTSTLNEHGFMVHGIDCKVIDPEILSNMSLSDQLIEDQKEGLLNLVI